MLSSACQDTIRAVVWLSLQEPGKYYRIQSISVALDLPFNFLAKSLQKLVHANLLISMRGASGGVALARAASQIKLIEIILAVDGSAFFENCVLGMGECESETPCSLHAQWSQWRDEIHELYSALTIGEITDDYFHRKIKRI